MGEQNQISVVLGLQPSEKERVTFGWVRRWKRVGAVVVDWSLLSSLAA